MIESIEIEKLRGIRQGKLEGLTPLTVLVGPNGSGKSTVLDALLIGASPLPGDAVGRAVKRHTRRDADARWLLWRWGEEGAAVLRVQTAHGNSRECILSWQQDVPIKLETHLREEKRAEEPFTCIETRCKFHSQAVRALTLFSADNSYVDRYDPEEMIDFLKMEPRVSLIDMRSTRVSAPLPSIYTAASKQGRRKDVSGLLSELVPGLESVDILVNIQNEPVLYLVFPDKAVPVALAGDGIRSVLRLGLELAAQSSGLVLIEEPEVHQHPRALRQSAKALMAGMRRGLQIVLSTHSLELIDSLLGEATQEDLQQLSTYQLSLEQGVLVSSRFSGDQMAFARGRIEEDLR